jgi:hypothetical protein
MAKVTIEVEAAKLDDAIKQAFNKKKGQFNVPGFRKGKVPFQLIAKEYGVEIFYEDAANILIPDAYAEAMKDTDLEIVSRPEIDVTQLEKGKDFIFTATFALKPEVTLGDYKGIEVPKTRVTVKKDEIEEELKKVQEQNAREITIEDRAVKDGDILTIDYSGSVDGVKFEGGTAEDQTLVIGSGAFIPGFEEQLVGKNLNETADINVTFPEEYHAPDLAGKDAVFTVTVKAAPAPAKVVTPETVKPVVKDNTAEYTGLVANADKYVLTRGKQTVEISAAQVKEALGYIADPAAGFKAWESKENFTLGVLSATGKGATKTATIKGTSNYDGKYTATVTKVSDTEYAVVAKSEKGQNHNIKVTVAKDGTVTATSAKYVVTSDKNATNIVVKDAAGKVIASATAKDGKYTVKLPADKAKDLTITQYVAK